MALIDLSNYATTLHQASSSSFTDGNVFFDPATGTGEISFGDASTYSTYTPTAATSATTISTTAPDQITRATGHWAKDDGWRPGMLFTLANSGTQDGTFEIESISADGLSITTVETTLSTEAGSGDETGTAAAVTNELLNLDGLRFEAVYAFENRERRWDEALRAYDRWTRGTFKFGGSYDFINGRVPASDADRKLLRGSGWRELTGTTVNRIYFGPRGLGAILSNSTPYYQTSQYATGADLVDFTKPGNIDEAFQVFGDAANGNFDNTLSSHYFSIRTYGQNYDRIDTNGTLGIAELGGYSSGAALNESNHLSTGNYPYASVAPDDTISETSQSVNFVSTSTARLETSGATDWTALGFGVGSQIAFTGTVSNDLTFTIDTITDDLATNDLLTFTTSTATVEAAGGDEAFTNVQIAPWTGMSLEKLDTAQTETGFADTGNGTSADFTWVLNNTSPGDLLQCVAYLDALATIDGTVTIGPTSPVNLNGKAYDEWYTYAATGDILTQNGEGTSLGFFIEGLSGTDLLNINVLADDANIYEYPVVTPITVELGQTAIDDLLAWFHIFTAASFNTASPVTYLDAVDAEVKGDADNSSSFITGANTFLSFNHDFTGDGSVNVVILCEGDGGATQAKTTATFADTTVSTSCEPAVENNA